MPQTFNEYLTEVLGNGHHRLEPRHLRAMERLFHAGIPSIVTRQSLIDWPDQSVDSVVQLLLDQRQRLGGSNA